MTALLRAMESYRDSPNTYGHEKSDTPRRELKKLMGAVASQRYLQDSINDAMSNPENPFEDFSLGIRHLWVRLKDNEDVLRDAEARYKVDIAARKYMTLPGRVHPVPSIAVSIAQMEAKAS